MTCGSMTQDVVSKESMVFHTRKLIGFLMRLETTRKLRRYTITSAKTMGFLIYIATVILMLIFGRFIESHERKKERDSVKGERDEVLLDILDSMNKDP